MLLSLLTLAATVGLVAAQDQGGRSDWSRGSVGFGCWATRPTLTGTAPYYQTGNAASVAACSVSALSADPLLQHHLVDLTSQANCAVLRPGDPSLPLFWYWQGGTQNCWCGNLYQRPQQQQSGNTPCFTGAGDTRGQWAYGRISTTFTTFGTSACRTRAAVGLANSAFSTGQVGPVGCHGQCRNFRFAYWWSDVSVNEQCPPRRKLRHQTATNLFRCACSNDIQTGIGASATCAQNTVFVSTGSMRSVRGSH